MKGATSVVTGRYGCAVSQRVNEINAGSGKVEVREEKRREEEVRERERPLGRLSANVVVSRGISAQTPNLGAKMLISVLEGK